MYMVPAKFEVRSFSEMIIKNQSTIIKVITKRLCRCFYDLRIKSTCVHTGVRSDERIVDWKSQFPQLGSRLQHREANGTLTVPGTGIYLVRIDDSYYVMTV